MKYIRNSLIYITIFGMEVCWLYAILNTANKSVDNVLYVPFLLSVFILSATVSTLLKRLSWPKVALTVLSWLLWPAAMLLMIKFQLFPGAGFSDIAWLTSLPQAFSSIFYKFEAPLLIFVSTAVLWWLGRRLAYLKPEFSAAIAESQLGLIMLVIIFFINYELKLEQSSSANLAIGFFFLALLGISVSHSPDNSWLLSSRKGYWLGIVLICIAVVLVLGLLVSYIFTPDLIDLIIKALKWVWGIIEKIMAFVASLFPSPAPDSSAPSPVPILPPGNKEESHFLSLPEWLRPGLSLVWEILVGGLLLVAIWRIASDIFRWMHRHLPSGGDEVESLKGAFKTDLINFLKRILSVVFRIKFKNRDPGLKNIPPEISTARQLYTQFLHWAAAGGYPRDKSQTPEEYRLRLTQIKPENRKELEFITGEYMNVRYGSSIPTQENLNRLRETWQNLKKTGFKKSRG